jgi:hypothetical protein
VLVMGMVEVGSPACVVTAKENSPSVALIDDLIK